jgi:hypothetical protein
MYAAVTPVWAREHEKTNELIKLMLIVNFVIQPVCNGTVESHQRSNSHELIHCACSKLPVSYSVEKQNENSV